MLDIINKEYRLLLDLQIFALKSHTKNEPLISLVKA